MKSMVHCSIVVVAGLLLTAVTAQSDIDDATFNRYGLDVDKPGYSCANIYEMNPSSRGRSGPYLIKTSELFLAQCDMETELEGKKKGWLKIADIDVSKGDKCPEGWNKTKANGIETCRAPSDSAGCYSTTFSVNGTKYRKIRGRVRGYQQGSVDSFDSRRGHRGINTAYVDGVSITLGYPRKHVWTYIAGISDDHRYPTSNCPCAAVPGPAPPSFVGEHYYCESGNNGTYQFNVYYTDDPLWDGAGCFHDNNNCCTNVDQPWFLRQFITTQHDDIEVRICTDQNYADEAVLVDQVTLLIQ